VMLAAGGKLHPRTILPRAPTGSRGSRCRCTRDPSDVKAGGPVECRGFAPWPNRLLPWGPMGLAPGIPTAKLMIANPG
jgi:hypothetical protein